MTQPPLFAELPPRQGSEPRVPTRRSEARVKRPVGNQVEWAPRALDALLPEGHLARAIWALVERLDVSAFYGTIEAVVDGPGRSATDPAVVLALWLYATAEGIGSARQLDRLCREHDGYRWLRGGVPINYHLLSDFRVEHGRELDGLLTDLLTVLTEQGLVTLERVAQDGVRVRASAGAGSFRREATLRRLRAAAAEQVNRLAEAREQPDPQGSRREVAARERAAREREVRVSQALAALPAVQALKKTPKEKAEARVSTTDPAARVMKMPDGGFRPAFNVQLATETEHQFIVGVSVSNRGSDLGSAPPMVEQIAARCGQAPGEYLVDGGFAKLEDIETLAQADITVYAPPQKPKKADRDPATPRLTDTPGVAAWRERMGTEQAKAIYQDRAATAECVNAQFRGRYGLTQFTVRGIVNVTSVGLLTVLTHNLLRWQALLTSG